MANNSRAHDSAGKIYLPPIDSSVAQFWVNIGYDSSEGFKVPEYISHFQSVCSRQAYESLMIDVEKLFTNNAQSRMTVFVRRRPEFEATLERILKHHQKSVSNGKPNWPPKMLRWAYGKPVAIEPYCAYDHMGEVLVSAVDAGGYFEDHNAWPPPFYNIIINIPMDQFSSIRSRWAMGKEMNFQKEFNDRNHTVIVKNPCYKYVALSSKDVDVPSLLLAPMVKQISMKVPEFIRSTSPDMDGERPSSLYKHPHHHSISTLPPRQAPPPPPPRPPIGRPSSSPAVVPPVAKARPKSKSTTSSRGRPESSRDLLL